MSRRFPQQARGRATYGRILDAAQAIVAEHGAEALTPTQVADESGVAIGTVYSYFDGADGMIDALVDRHLDALVTLTQDVIDRDALTDVTSITDELIDAFVRYYTSTPGFAQVWYGPAFTHRHGVADREATDAMVELSADLLVDVGLVDEITDEIRRELAVNWRIGEALLDAAARSEPFDHLYVAAAKETIRLRLERPDSPLPGRELPT